MNSNKLFCITNLYTILHKLLSILSELISQRQLNSLILHMKLNYRKENPKYNILKLLTHSYQNIKALLLFLL
jgi:hypothetical protein